MSKVEITKFDWTDSEWNQFQIWLLGVLKMTNVTVTFEKQDKSIRVMSCTLQPEILPKVEIKENKKERKKSENTIVAYDTEKNDWRSFNIKSVKKIQFTIE